VFFASDEIAFRLTLRVDGQRADTTTKPRDGTTTVAPLVAIETRN
jgi:hypothetical protein